MSGLVLWGFDIAGYFGEPTPECFIRWSQFAALTPIMLFHGLGKRNPWQFDRETFDIVRKYVELHDRLALYSFSFAHGSAKSGYPIIRPMALEFPDEKEAVESEYQYMYGSELLVAPVYWEGGERSVYIPTGTWINYWDDSVVEGPQSLDLRVPLDVLPLWPVPELCFQWPHRRPRHR